MLAILVWLIFFSVDAHAAGRARPTGGQGCVTSKGVAGEWQILTLNRADGKGQEKPRRYCVANGVAPNQAPRNSATKSSPTSPDRSQESADRIAKTVSGANDEVSQAGRPEACQGCERQDPGFHRDSLEVAQASGLQIDANGLIPVSESGSPRVKHQLSSRFTGSRYSTGKPVGIIFHKTAGRTCGSRKSIGEEYRRPHVYICRDGTIIQNGSFDRPRNGAEKGHNDWSISIEFEAAYAPKPYTCQKPEGGLHCYEALTPAQLAWGQAMTRALSGRYKIPIQPALQAQSA
ncbi:MAG: N-acetylmuramoyl-L-alanine amidase, partial [Bdellovibrionales bacterium]|nr:N-acetylmuramoyl-L-alanine amidase [Bdellovibrionales bacterium]